jgi:GDSL-like Lipase/Acylhydrolase family
MFKLTAIQLLLATLTCLQSSPLSDWERFREKAVSSWDKEVCKLESLDLQQADSLDSILFVGSSSIRLWETMPADMSPWPTVRRGYGGAKLTDLIFFIERLIAKHDYRALVIFVANDITGDKSEPSGDKQDRTPEEVQELYRILVGLVRKTHPQKPIFIVAITPTPKRFHVWDKINQANQLIKAYCQTDPLLHFIDTAPHYLDSTGMPRDELFVADKLHQNDLGYKIWGNLIKAALQANLETSPAQDRKAAPPQPPLLTK